MRYAIVLLLIAVASLGLRAQDQLQLIDAKLTIAGTSNIHDWTSTAERILVEGTYTFAAGELGIPALRVKIPVESIKSSKGRIMDNKTYEALQSDKFPEISFVLKNAEMQPNSITAKGILTIAGQSKTIQLHVNRQVDAKGVLVFSGQKNLKMTDFGVDPPTALLGTLKTGDAVTITYQLRFRVDPEVAGRR